MILFLKLILAHLIGDFLLQSSKSVKSKEEKKLKSPALYYHIFFHAAVTSILLWDTQYWAGILFIVITHFLIDASKLSFQSSKNGKYLFFLDQALHILVLSTVWMYYEGNEFSLAWLQSTWFLLSVISLYFLTQPTSIIIKVLISNWSPQTEEGANESLENAGKYIGILERLFVFVFVVTGNWDAIGFLIAAKSVFRFGDLKESKDRKLTEYILIGTLISFGIAILVGYAYTRFLR